MKITADKMVVTKNGKEDPATYKLDTSKTPHEIDMIGEGNSMGRTTRCTASSRWRATN